MIEERQTTDLWHIADQCRSLRQRIDLPGLLASLLVLHWAAHEEAEEEAIASFEEKPFIGTLPKNLRLEAWSEAGNRIIQGITQDTAHLDQPSAKSPVGRFASLVSPIAMREAKIAANFLPGILSWVNRADWDSTEGRSATAEQFESFLEQMVDADGKQTGVFYTPGPIVDLMVEIMDPKPGERIYDPCFGSGGILASAARRIRSLACTVSPETWSKVQRESIFGIELNSRMYAIGLCRILLAGIQRPGLELGDAIDRPTPRDRSSEGFDCVLASIPFGGRQRDNIPTSFPISSTYSEDLFVQHVMKTLKQGGRACVIVPNGFLFRVGSSRQVRKALLDECRVEGVIALPEGSFRPYTNIETNLLVFRRDKPRKTIRFLSLGKDEAAKIIGVPAKVVSAFRAEEPSPHSWDVTIGSLERRDYELVVRRSGAEGLDEALKRLKQVAPKLEIETLGKAADVFIGTSYEGKTSTKNPNSPNVIAGLLRVADVVDGRIGVPALHLLKSGEGRVRKEQYIKREDVLLTASGTIGKIGIVPEMDDNKKIVATKSLTVIRCGNTLSPHFLTLLLNSPAYRDWLHGHARGATIQHLSVRTLRSLEIPIPPITIQHAVVHESTPSGSDVLAILVRRLKGEARDALSEWLDTPFAATYGMPNDQTTALVDLSRLSNELSVLRNKWAHGADDQVPPEFAGVMRNFGKLAEILKRIDEIPKGTSRLTVIALARDQVEAIRLATKGCSEGPLKERVIAFTERVLSLLESEQHATMEDISIGIRVEPTDVGVGVDSEVRLIVKNTSSTAIRNLSLNTRPPVGGGHTAYLGDGDETAIPLTVNPKSEGEVGIEVDWRASRLDGTSIKGINVIHLLARSIREIARAEFGTSPYIVGSPVDRDEMFFGREDVMDRIRIQLGSSGTANVILLEGNRRTGKTSILKQLQKKNALPEWIPVYCSFQDVEGDERCAGVPTRNVYRLMTRTIVTALRNEGVSAWLPGEAPPSSREAFIPALRKALSNVFSDEHPFEVFETFLVDIIQTARPRRVLLMLDEFDKLQEGIDSGVTSPQVPENIRHLLQHHPEFTAILTGSRRLKRLREEYWSALFGLGYRISVSGLPVEASGRLVTEPVSGRLTYLPKARDIVVETCARHPYLIQCLCNRIFERAVLNQERTVTPDAVMMASDEMIEDNEHFRTLWDYAQTERRRLILLLCAQFEDDPDAVTSERLKDELKRREIPLAREKDLVDDLDHLGDLEFIEYNSKSRGGTYRITIPLFSRWLLKSIAPEDITLRARHEALEAIK